MHTDFGNGDKPTTTLSKEKLDSLAEALYFQLNERMSFVKDKDPIVAVLLHALGDIEYLLKNRNDAARDYTLAVKYGYVKKDQKAQELEKANDKASGNGYFIVALSAIVTLLSVGIMLRRKRQRVGQ